VRAEFQEYAYAAPHDMQVLFFSFIDQLHIAGTNGCPWDPDSSMSLPGIGVFINMQQAGTVEITVGFDDVGIPITKTVPKWLATLMHELGHSIDYLTGATTESGLGGLVQNDVRNRLTDEASEISFKLNDPNADMNELRRQAVENIMNGQTLPASARYGSDLERMQYLLQTKMRDISRGEERLVADDGAKYPTDNSYIYHGMSDTYGGVTVNATRDERSWGHNDDYWTGQAAATGALGGGPEGSISYHIPVITPELELWANNFESRMLGDLANQEANRQYYPEANAQMDAEYERILEEARARIA
jgi:hypothetical protein